jgi:hypothetical protein
LDVCYRPLCLLTTGFYGTDCLVKFSKHLSDHGSVRTNPNVGYLRQCLSDLNEESAYPAVTMATPDATDQAMVDGEPVLTHEEPHMLSPPRSTAGDHLAYHLDCPINALLDQSHYITQWMVRNIFLNLIDQLVSREHRTGIVNPPLII